MAKHNELGKRGEELAKKRSVIKDIPLLKQTGVTIKMKLILLPKMVTSL